jgi:hypothetical protein
VRERIRFWYVELDKLDSREELKKGEFVCEKACLEEMPGFILGKIAGYLPKEVVLDTFAMASPKILSKLVGEVRWSELICEESLESVRLGDLCAIGAVRKVKLCKGFESLGKVNDMIFKVWMERFPRFFGAKVI